MTTPIWTPKHPEKSHMYHFMRFVEQTHSVLLPDYQALHTWSVQHINLFWQAICDYFQIHFATPATAVLQYDKAHAMHQAHWFRGARLNAARTLLSRNDEHLALISIDEQGRRTELTYRALQQQVDAAARGLQQAGVLAGDRVVGIMPNVSYTVIAMLAAASIGAIWASCSSDFGVSAAVDRLGQIDPVILFVSDGHDYHGKTHLEWDKIEAIHARIPSLKHIIVCPVINEPIPTALKAHLKAHLLTWDEWMSAPMHCDQAPSYANFPFEHPMYILFSSGTTGKPKCIVHSVGGTLLQHIKELGLHTDLHANDNLFFYTTCGWMMWNWMISALALGATITLYEGSPTYPTPMRLFEIIDQERVSVFGTSPKFLSSIAHTNTKPNTTLRMSNLRCILSTGAPLLPEQYDYVAQNIATGVQISSISGGTDIVSCFALGNPLLPVYPGELQSIGLGMAVAIYDDTGHAIQGAKGELVCEKPFPSMPIGFWNDPTQTSYKHAYFSRFNGIWAHGDFAELTPNHGLIIYGRSDAILNPGGVRIGTAEIYRQIEKIPAIIDSVVIGQNWQNDVRVVLFVKLRPGLQLEETLIQTIRQTIRTHASPRHVPNKIIQVNDIPRTISGKLVELAVRQAVNGELIPNLSSLANPEALNDFKQRPELCID